MSELIEKLRPEFQDKEYRHAYAEECLNSMIAAQIKILREQRRMTQKQLATESGMAQPRIPLLEDASYENWTINTLKRLAKAFDIALSVKFETFSTFIEDFENLSRESLERPSFPRDARFQMRSDAAPRRRSYRTRQMPNRRRSRNWAPRLGQVQVSTMGIERKPPKPAQVAIGAPSPQDAGSGLHLVPRAAGGN